jgi:hypothetical protein
LAEYDLGTAHGRIEIESDSRGTAAVIRQLAELRAAAASLERSFNETRASLEEFSNNVRDAGTSSDNSGRRVSGLSGFVRRLGSDTIATAANVRQLTNDLSSLAQSAAQSAQRVEDLRSTISRFTSLRGALGGMVASLVGVDEQLANAPRWQRDIVGAARAIAAFGVGSAIIRKVGLSFGAMIASTAGFGLLAPRVSTFVRGMRLMLTTAALLSPRFAAVGGAIRGLGASMGLVGSGLNSFVGSASRAVRGMSQMVLGGLLVQKALQGVAAAAKVSILALSGLSAVAAGLQVIGTAALGTVNAVKQLSGALLVVPGVIAAAGIAAGVAKLAFSGMGEAFKAAALTGKDFEDKIKDMSPTMRSVARSAQSMYNEFKKLKDIAQITALTGFANDIRLIGNTYLPTLQRGISAVGTGINRVKDGFRDFLLQPATIKDVNDAFQNTRTVLDNLSRAVWPFMAALRDVASVSLEVFTGISNGAGQAAVRFANFVSEARRTGELKQFILDGIQGFKDLGSAISSASSALKTIFESFGASGDNALARLSKSAQSFEDSMKGSASGGKLDQIASSLKEISEVSLEIIVTALNQLAEISARLAPFAQELQESFGAGLVTAFNAVGAAAQVFASVISNIPGLGGFLGSILAIGIALKAMALLFTPIVRGVQLMIGVFTLLRGSVATITGLNGALTLLAARGGVVGATFGRVRTAMIAATAAAGALTAAIAAIAVAWFAIDAAHQNVESSLKRIADREKEVQQETDNLVAALTDSGGQLSKNVFEVIGNDLKNMIRDLEDTGDQIPGTMAGAGAALETAFTRPATLAKSLFQGISGDGQQMLDSLQGTAVGTQLNLKLTGEAAEAAGRQIQQMGISAEDMSRMIVGSDADIKVMVEALAKTENGGREASVALRELRDQTLPIVESMARLGPEAIHLSEAMKVLSDAGSSAADKMNALKTALQSLGILESSATEAMFNISKAVQEIATAGTGLKEGGGFGTQLLNSLGQLSGASTNAVILRDRLKELGDQLIQVAANGGDITAAFNNMSPAFAALARDSGLSETKILELARAFGVVPNELSVLVAVAGKDQAVAELTALTLQAQQLGAGVHEIKMVMKDQDAINALKALNIQVELVNATTGEVRINVDTAQLEALQIALSQMKNNQPVTIPAPKVEVPQVPPAQPAPPSEQPNIPAPKVDVPQTPPPTTPPPVTTPIPAPPVTKPVTPEPAPPTTLPIIPAPKVEVPVVPPLPEIPALAPIVLRIEGVDVAIGGINNVSGAITGLNGAIDGSVGKWNEYAGAVRTAIQGAINAINEAVTSIGSALKSAASTAQASGSALGAGFAAGIRSQVDAVRAAALALAEAAAAPLPKSPAKIGPFSGSGWTPFRGRSLAEGFAQGIASGAASAQDAALLMAAGISAALDSVRGAFGQPQAKLEQNRIPGAAGSLFIRDPEISDAALAEKRAAKQKAKADSDAENERFRESDEREKRTDKEAKASGKAVESAEKLAERFDLTIASNKRDEPGSFHNTGEAFDFSGSAENMKKLNEYLAKNDPKARELFYDPGTSIKEGQKIPGIGGHTDHVHYVPSKKTEKASEDLASNTKKTTQSQSEIVDAIVAEGVRRGLSEEEIAGGVSAGIVESNLQNLNYGDRDSQGVFQQRPSQGWGAPGSVEQDTKDFFDRLEKTDPSKSIGARVQDVQRSAFPSKYAEQLAKAQALTQESIKRQGGDIDSTRASSLDTAENTDILAKNIDTGDPKVDESIKLLQSGNASDADVIRALQDVDDTIATTSDRTVHEDLKSLKSAIMEDRGIKEFDPFEGASDDLFGDVLSVVQGIVGLFDTIEGGLTAATTAAEILIRGFQNTKDVTTFIDSVQSVFSSVGEIVSTVSNVISTVASIAALAGALIPGIGQVAAVASVVTGGIGNVNAVVDLAQQVFKIVGRFAGGILSAVAGGPNGPLMGNVRVLLDTNDNTIKTWSDDNPQDKRVRSLNGGAPVTTQNNQSTQAVGTLQVFGGPGDDPNKVMADAMFAIRASQIGAGAYG